MESEPRLNHIGYIFLANCKCPSVPYLNYIAHLLEYFTTSQHLFRLYKVKGKEVYIMKKFLAPVLALMFVLVPVQGLYAGTSQATTASNVRLVYRGTTQIPSISGNTICVSQYLQKQQLVQRPKNTSAYVVKIKSGTWPKAFPVKVTPVKLQPAPKPDLLPKPAPESDPVPTSPPAQQTDSGPVTVPAAPNSSLQTEMLGYINAERTQAGISPLTLDKTMSGGAYLKSQDMAVNGYFSHNSPTYGSPFTMMKGLGISYNMAGENIAKNTSVKGAHTSFMNSAGHKANILNSRYQKVGLGFYQKGAYLYVTQWFSD